MLSRVSNSIDICTVAIKNIRNMHAVSTNQNADILHFNGKAFYQNYRIYHAAKSTSLQELNCVVSKNLWILSRETSLRPPNSYVKSNLS